MDGDRYSEVETRIIFVSDNKYYLEIDGIRLIYEDDRLIGWYHP